MEKVLKYSIPFFLLYAFVFLLFPSIDIRFSSLFYDGGFVSKSEPLAGFFYESVNVLNITLLVVLLGLFAYEQFKKKPLIQAINKKAIIFLLSFFVVIGGVVVNNTLKEFSGRARPSKVVEFGGSQEFSPAILKSQACHNHNCSFSSGHSAFAFSMMVFALLFPAFKNRIFGAAALYGVLVSLARIAQGGHFLSDTLFSFFAALFGVQLFYYIFYPDKAPSYYKRNGIFFAYFYLILITYYLHQEFLG